MYEAEVVCLNCGFEGTVEIPKSYTIVGQTCPNCGCRTIKGKNDTKNYKIVSGLHPGKAGY